MWVQSLSGHKVERVGVELSRMCLVRCWKWKVISIFPRMLRHVPIKKSKTIRFNNRVSILSRSYTKYLVVWFKTTTIFLPTTFQYSLSNLLALATQSLKVSRGPTESRPLDDAFRLG